MKELLNVTGMACSACSTRVEKAVGEVKGVTSCSVNLLQNNMLVEYNEEETTKEAIIGAVEKAGYHAAPKSGEGEKTLSADKKTSKKEVTEKKAFERRLIWSVIFLLPLMYITMGHMINLPLPSFLNGMEHAVAFAMSQLILVLPVMYINRTFYKRGFRAISHKAPNMDSLIAIGSGAAFIYGIYAIRCIYVGMNEGNMELVKHFHENLYFESVSMILTLITVGKYLEARSKGKTSKAIEKLIELAPDMAMVEREGEEISIAVKEVVEGDILVARPGVRFPVDGIVTEGTASVDESAITGESMPVSKNVNDTIISATVNVSGFIKFRATKVGKDTTLAQITSLVEEAASSKAPIARLADKIAGIFVPIVILISILTAAVWLLCGASFEFALTSAIAVLVISCPCALGLATPTAIMVGTGKGAENGILIKTAESLETLHEVDTVVFDKTGTITKGEPEVTDFTVEKGFDPTRIMACIAALEVMSEHPLGKAIVKYSEAQRIGPLKADNFEVMPGKGIRAMIDNEYYYAGNERILTTNNIQLGEKSIFTELLAREGKTVLFFTNSNELLAIFAIADVIKPTSKAAAEELNKLDLSMQILTGDNEITAKAMAKKIGVQKIIAEVFPAEKEREIYNLQKQGKKVAMVGDGINDAPALMRSDVGIAIGAGTDIALESADIVLIKSDLMDVARSIKLSKAVIKNIKENLFWAFFYNILGIPLAAGVFYPFFGWQLNPMFAAFAMSLSSLFVVSNALRLRFIKL